MSNEKNKIKERNLCLEGEKKNILHACMQNKSVSNHKFSNKSSLNFLILKRVKERERKIEFQNIKKSSFAPIYFTSSFLQLLFYDTFFYLKFLSLLQKKISFVKIKQRIDWRISSEVDNKVKNYWEIVDESMSKKSLKSHRAWWRLTFWSFMNFFFFVVVDVIIIQRKIIFIEI